MSLTAGEQYLIELINRGRLDPAAEAARYNLDLNAGLAARTIRTEALQVLAPNAALDTAATRHSDWMVTNDSFSHTGAGGSDAGARMQGAGYTFTGTWGWRENLAWLGSTGGIDIEASIAQHHEGLYRSEHHRVNTFAAEMREIGVGQVGGSFTYQGTTYNSSMVTEKFALSGTDVFVTGVAYRDANRDNFYSIGEGQGNVWVKAGGAQDVTAAAGGYAVAVHTQADLLVEVGVGNARLAALNIDTRNGNVKVDVVAQAGGGRELELSGSAKLLAGIADARLLGGADLDLEGHGAHNDLVGNSGDNVISGRGGNDRMWGMDGKDWLIGGMGNDVLYGGGGNDLLAGNNHIDRLYGGEGNDQIMAGHGIDFAWGGNGNDKIFGQGGNDRVYGENGNDALFGNAGNDMLYGGAGNDRLYGGDGNDALHGGAGADLFVFSGGRDRIQDFTDNVDTLYFTQAQLGDGNLSVQEVLSMGRIVNGSAVFDMGHGDVLTVEHISNLDILVNDIVIF